MLSTALESSWRISRVVLTREKLFEAETVLLFKRVFLRALGWNLPPELASLPAPTEAERLSVVPLVFGLIPSRALVRAKRDERIKPHIREHLIYIGLEPDESLIDIVKAVADQYYATQSEGSLGVSTRPRKYGISDIKALNRRLYQKMLGRQNHRCAICGVTLSRATEETLDHILPWRLIGDVPSGSNWQILCQECNSGKQAWFSALQSPEAINWIYARHDQPIPSDTPTLETRYVVLAQLGKCQAPGCTATAASGHLVLHKVVQSGLAIADNLIPRCESH
jgi:hypothetical protein